MWSFEIPTDIYRNIVLKNVYSQIPGKMLKVIYWQMTAKDFLRGLLKQRSNN
jgi:hypothetical protein